MQNNSELAAFCDEQSIPYVKAQPMSNYTTFKIGGRAELIIKPCTTQQVMAVASFCHSAGLQPIIIGNGSNLLVCDAGIKQPVLYIGAGISELHIDGETLCCGAGASLVKLCTFAAENSLSGLEFAYGIPGNVGGAVFMNAGAYDGEMKHIVASVSAVSPQGELKTFTAEECKFTYRHSIFADNGFCITDVKFKLHSGDKAKIRQRMDELMMRRTEKQPLEYPSGGSTFKRPQSGYASALIDDCGLKGRSVGGAKVSEKHAGFLINYRGAMCADMLSLIKLVQDEVKQKTGVALECEVKYIGE